MPEIEGIRRGNVLQMQKNTRNKKITLRILTRKNVKKSGGGTKMVCGRSSTTRLKEKLHSENNQRTGRNKREVLLKLKEKV